MKQYLPYIIGVLVVLGGIGVYLTTRDTKTSESGGQTSTQENNSKKTAALKYKDACKLFTREQIGAALGGTFSEGEEGIANTTATPGTPEYDNEELRGSACDFDQDDDGTTEGMKQAMTLSVIINNYATVDKADTYMKDLHNPQTAEGQAAIDAPVDVKGVGDQAFFTTVNTSGSDSNIGDKTVTLDVRMGRQIISLSVTQLLGLDREAVQSKLIDLAKRL